jgi:aspartate carbamoyltransferase regulatory subunit
MTTTNKSTLSVAAIKNGTVIDHISAGQGLTIVHLLGLSNQHQQVTIGLNLPSKNMGYKDLVKVEGQELTKNDVDRVAILAPTATINIIKEYTVTKKFKVTVPEKIKGLFTCPNPVCITNHETMATLFTTILNKKDLQLRCEFCEKIFSRTELVNSSHSV